MEIFDTGDIFFSDAQTIVNTVNCVGAMGKGLALQFKNQYPKMYLQYSEICKKGLLDIGKLWLYKDERRWVLNFPTKYHWRDQSKEYYLEVGLDKFLATYKEKKINSIAFPLLGASNGGLDPGVSLAIMERYLSRCDIPVSIYLKHEVRNNVLFS